MTYMYQEADQVYFLEPDYHISPTGRPTIYGAQLYNTEGVKLGYWHGSNMPVRLHKALQKFVVDRANKQRLTYRKR